ncbi:MAG: CDP-alcohol phosphatidyltransferase family protein [Sphingomonadales bacterium]|nr:CDP-alcohol phosphatidyltransferase family protein [Sphingomonadales bacterium]
MIDAALLPLQRAALAPPAAWLAARGVRADQVTIFGFALGLGAFAALWAGAFPLALALIALNRLCDGLDGAIARITGPTERGAFLDIALDFLFYALVPLGFALTDPARNALPAAVLITAFVGTGSSFLAFAAVAARRGLATPAYPHKGLAYLGGLTEGAETIAIFAAMCLWPAAFPVLALLFAAACALTTFMRWVLAWRAFTTE